MKRRRWSRVRAGGLAVLLVVLGGLVAAPAGATTGPSLREEVASLAIDLDVREDGSLQVTEEVDYDFGPVVRRGFFRVVPDRREPQGRRVPVTPLSDVRVRSATAPDAVERFREGDATVLRVGDPQLTVSGRHTYVLSYVVRGAVVPDEEGSVLRWDAAGTGWQVPVQDVTVALSTPAAPLSTTCVTGDVGDEGGCSLEVADGGGLLAGPVDLGRRQGLTVTAVLPAGAVATEGLGPLYAPRRDLVALLDPVPTAVLPAAGVLAAGLAGLAALAATRRSPEQAAGSAFVGAVPTGPRPGGTSGSVAVRPHGGPASVAVLPHVSEASTSASDAVRRSYEEGPPLPPGHGAVVPDREDRARVALEEARRAVARVGAGPGTAAVLWRDRCDDDAVTAVLVDLAVQGWVRVSQRGETWRVLLVGGRDGHPDPVSDSVLRRLFDGREELVLNPGSPAAHGLVPEVRARLQDDAVARGWYRPSPSAQLSRLRAAGVGVVVAGVALAVLLARTSGTVLPGLALSAVGVLLVAVARRLVHPTTAGGRARASLRDVAAALAGVDAARPWLTPDQREEASETVLQLTGWAVAVGEEHRWAELVDDLVAADRLQQTWDTRSGRFTVGDMALLYAASSLASAPMASAGASSVGWSDGGSFGGGSFGGGGSVGGGFGGGGGGSW